MEVIPGTVVSDIAALTSILARQYGLDLEMVVQRLIFDWRGKFTCQVGDQLGFEMDACFGPEDFVEARLNTDKAALRKVEEQGDLYPVPERWADDPGSILENMGAGGEPIMALVLAILNRRPIRRRLRKMIQEAIAHAGQDQRVIQEIDDGRLCTRLIAKLRLSAVGGMGSGAMHWFLGEDGIQSCARQDGVEVSVILQVLCRGNLETKDDQRADLNEYMTLKYLQARCSATYVSPLTGHKQPLPCTALLLASGLNTNGDMTNLRQVQAHEAHCDHFLFYTPAGARMRELLIDILEPQHSEYGEPLAGKTVSCAFLSRNSNRVLKSCKYRASAVMARAATAQGDADRVRQHAASLARQANLVETEEDNQLTRSIMHPEELGRQDVVATARGSFEDRTRRCHGLTRLGVAVNALAGILNEDIPQRYESCMRRQARTQAQAIQDLLEKHQDQMMRTPCGLAEARQLYAAFRLIAHRSQEALMQKTAELKGLLAPHEQVIAEAAEETDSLQRSGFFARHINLPLVRRLWASLDASGPAAISFQLQMAACTIAVNDLLMPVIAYLDHQLAWLDTMEQKLLQTAQVCETRAEEIAAQSNTLMVPKGIELTDGEYLTDFFTDQVTKRGGRDAFAAFLLGQFFSKYGSLAYLTDAPLEEYEKVFSEIGEAVFRPAVEQTDVLSEFQRLYPEPGMQLKILDRLIKQSEGCVQVTGEMNAPVVWIKTANAPSEAAAEWLRERLDRTDKKTGTWEVQVHQDRDRIGIAQLRGQIPLQSLLDRIGLPDDPTTWARLIKHAPDPVSVIGVPPNPSQRQLKRVLAKAIATGQLAVDGKGHFTLQSSDGETLVLGTDFDTVQASLQRRWRELVFTESTFGSCLVVDEDRIIKTLQQLKSGLQAKGPDQDPRLAVIHPQAVEESLTQAELLLPRLRRFRQTRQKRLSHGIE